MLGHCCEDLIAFSHKSLSEVRYWCCIISSGSQTALQLIPKVLESAPSLQRTPFHSTAQHLWTLYPLVEASHWACWPCGWPIASHSFGSAFPLRLYKPCLYKGKPVSAMTDCTLKYLIFGKASRSHHAEDIVALQRQWDSRMHEQSRQSVLVYTVIATLFLQVHSKIKD